MICSSCGCAHYDASTTLRHIQHRALQAETDDLEIPRGDDRTDGEVDAAEDIDAICSLKDGKVKPFDRRAQSMCVRADRA